MENHQKIILDLGGGTGSWAKPYKKAGYNVITITLPDFDVTKFSRETVKGVRWLTFHGGKKKIVISVKDIYGNDNDVVCYTIEDGNFVRHGCGN